MLPADTVVPRGQVAHLECVGEIQLALVERLAHVDDHLLVGLQHRVPVLEQVLDVAPIPSRWPESRRALTPNLISRR